MATSAYEDNVVKFSDLRPMVRELRALNDESERENILEGTGSGNLVQVDDAYPSPLLKLTAYGNSVQDGTPTPDAPVEIKSVAGVKAHTAGVNLIKPQSVATKTSNGITFSVDNAGLITASGTSTGNGDINILFGNAPVFIKSGTKVTFSLSDGGTRTGSTAVFFYNTLTKDYDTYFFIAPNSNFVVGTFSHDSLVTNIIMRTSSGQTINLNAYASLAIGDSVNYSPSQISTTPLTLVDDQGVAHELRKTTTFEKTAQDVLVFNADGSGTLYAKTGKVDLGTLSWTKYTGQVYSYFYAPYNVAEMNGPITCEAYPAVLSYTAFNNASKAIVAAFFVSRGFNIRNTDYDSSTAEEFAATLTGVEAIYALATPQTYHIPAINMPALPDVVANCWLSATDASGAAIPCEIGIEYRRDVNHVIDSIGDRIDATAAMIAPVEGDTASANYAVGSYLVSNGVLYRVTQAIASGETITPGTNVTATTVMAEIASING